MHGVPIQFVSCSWCDDDDDDDDDGVVIVESKEEDGNEGKQENKDLKGEWIHSASTP